MNVDAARTIANASGYLFQIAVESQIRGAWDRRKRQFDLMSTVDVEAREYPWQNGDGDEGYIDLVARKAHVLFVLECKRVKDGVWVFQREIDADPDTRFVRCLGTKHRDGSLDLVTSDYHASPTSPAAEFCSVRGGGESRPSQLERLCRNLLDSLEALAVENNTKLEPTHARFNSQIYVPVIVTNATLVDLAFDPAEIQADGRLPSDSGEVDNVPWIRFHKTLGTDLTRGFEGKALYEAIADRERTVFIVNSESLVEFLGCFYISG